MGDKLYIYYQNCRGLRTKLNTLYMNILSECYDIIILTETWLIPAISDNEFIDGRYNVFRSDRNRLATNKQDGGGTLVAVRRQISATRINLSEPPYNSACFMPPNVDYVAIQLTSYVHNENHLICGIYLPPALGSSVYMDLLSGLQFVCTENLVDNFLIAGDFNIPTIDWCLTKGSSALTPSPSNNSEINRIFLDFISMTNCLQFNYAKNCNNSTLDLFLSNMANCECAPPVSPLVPVDKLHPPMCIDFNINLSKTLPKAPVTKYQFIQGNYNLINLEIEKIDWESLLNNLTSSRATEQFYEIIYNIIKTHIPQKIVKPNDFPIWFTRPLIHIFKNKNDYWVKWKLYSNISDYEVFSMYRTRFRALSKKCFNTYINSIEEGLRDDVRVFWSYIHSFKSKPGIPSKVKLKHIESDNPEGVCELFAKFFQSVYEPSTLSPDFLPDDDAPHSPNTTRVLSKVEFSKDDVYRALLALDVTKGAGPDGIPPFFLKHAATSLCIPLVLLFNKCISEGTVPDTWKLANINPIHKCGSKDDVENYRPISILSALSKVFERLVHDAIYPHLHHQIIPAQHGFVKGKSTVTNLTVYTNFLFSSMDSRVQVDAIYTDFQKAFDKVDHRLLLQKLAYNGIRGDLLRWFRSYILNRTQKVVINGFSSSCITAPSGVPQGSILGPLLFVLFINDIESCFLHSHYLLYADDLKIYRNISDSEDCKLLQEDLDRLASYCNTNKLFLSIPKCKVITFTKKLNVTYFNYSLGSANLERVKTVRDLGVLFDDRLHFDQHITAITNKAFQMYGFVTRVCRSFRRPSTYIHLFNSLVRPHLEYASIIWNPLYAQYSLQIERVQRKFLRCVNYRCFHRKLSYELTLQKLSLPTLEQRRAALDAMFLYFLCHTNSCAELTNEIYYNIPSRSARIRTAYPHQLFFLNNVNTNAGLRAPLRRIMQNYNQLLHNIDIFYLSRYSFKISVHKQLHNTIK